MGNRVDREGACSHGPKDKNAALKWERRDGFVQKRESGAEPEKTRNVGSAMWIRSRGLDALCRFCGQQKIQARAAETSCQLRRRMNGSTPEPRSTSLAWAWVRSSHLWSQNPRIQRLYYCLFTGSLPRSRTSGGNDPVPLILDTWSEAY